MIGGAAACVAFYTAKGVDYLVAKSGALRERSRERDRVRCAYGSYRARATVSVCGPQPRKLR